MKAKGYRIAESLRLDEVPADRVTSEWRAGGDCFWIDFEASCSEAMEQHGGDIEVDPILMQMCEEDATEIARVIPTDDAIFFGLPVTTGRDDEPVCYFGALCLPRLLITLHPQPIESLERFARALRRTSVLDAPTTSSLVCAILILLSTQGVEQAQKLRRRVGDLTARMDRDANSVKLAELLKEKAAVRQLEILDEESSPVYAMLQVADTKALNLSELASYYQVVLSNTAFLTRIVDRLGGRMDDLHQRYAVNVQEKTNHRLAFLTVVSAIFLPLTLLAGIYGMNFEFMPELHFPYAYPVMLGVMLAIAVGLWRYFKRKGWFD